MSLATALNSNIKLLFSAVVMSFCADRNELRNVRTILTGSVHLEATFPRKLEKIARKVLRKRPAFPHVRGGSERELLYCSQCQKDPIKKKKDMILI